MAKFIFYFLSQTTRKIPLKKNTQMFISLIYNHLQRFITSFTVFFEPKFTSFTAFLGAKFTSFAKLQFIVTQIIKSEF